MSVPTKQRTYIRAMLQPHNHPGYLMQLYTIPLVLFECWIDPLNRNQLWAHDRANTEEWAQIPLPRRPPLPSTLVVVASPQIAGRATAQSAPSSHHSWKGSRNFPFSMCNTNRTSKGPPCAIQTMPFGTHLSIWVWKTPRRRRGKNTQIFTHCAPKELDQAIWIKA